MCMDHQRAMGWLGDVQTNTYVKLLCKYFIATFRLGHRTLHSTYGSDTELYF